MGIDTKVFNKTRDEVTFLDKIDILGVHYLDGGLQLEGPTIYWHAEPTAIGLGYTREKNGHEREAELDDGALRSSEQ